MMKVIARFDIVMCRYALACICLIHYKFLLCKRGAAFQPHLKIILIYCRDGYAIISKNSASVRIGIPRLWAFASLLPAFSPQIR